MLSGAAGPGFLVKGQFTPEAAEGSQRATHTRRHGEDGAPRGVRGGLGTPTVGTEGCAGGPWARRPWAPWPAVFSNHILKGGR